MYMTVIKSTTITRKVAPCHRHRLAFEKTPIIISSSSILKTTTATAPTSKDDVSGSWMAKDIKSSIYIDLQISLDTNKRRGGYYYYR